MDWGLLDHSERRVFKISVGDIQGKRPKNLSGNYGEKIISWKIGE